jgi:hypothetical protein
MKCVSAGRPQRVLLVIHPCPVPLHVPPVFNVCSPGGPEPLDRFHDAGNAATPVVFAVKSRHLGREPAWVHGKCKDPTALLPEVDSHVACELVEGRL